MTAAEICREQNIPYLVECVGNPWDALWYFGNKGKLAAPYFYWKTKEIIRRAPYVIYVTKEYLQTIFPTKGAWVACSNVTLPKQDARIFEKRLEHLRRGHQGPVIMGSAGKIDLRYKGYEWVIRTIRMLNEAGIRVRYELAATAIFRFAHSDERRRRRRPGASRRRAVARNRCFPGWMDWIFIFSPVKRKGFPGRSSRR